MADDPRWIDVAGKVHRAERNPGRATDGDSVADLRGVFPRRGGGIDRAQPGGGDYRRVWRSDRHRVVDDDGDHRDHWMRQDLGRLAGRPITGAVRFGGRASAGAGRDRFIDCLAVTGRGGLVARDGWRRLWPRFGFNGGGDRRLLAETDVWEDRRPGLYRVVHCRGNAASARGTFVRPDRRLSRHDS